MSYNFVCLNFMTLVEVHIYSVINEASVYHCALPEEDLCQSKHNVLSTYTARKFRTAWWC